MKGFIGRKWRVTCSSPRVPLHCPSVPHSKSGEVWGGDERPLHFLPLAPSYEGNHRAPLHTHTPRQAAKATRHREGGKDPCTFLCSAVSFHCPTPHPLLLPTTTIASGFGIQLQGDLALDSSSRKVVAKAPFTPHPSKSHAVH